MVHKIIDANKYRAREAEQLASRRGSSTSLRRESLILISLILDILAEDSGPVGKRPITYYYLHCGDNCL